MPRLLGLFLLPLSLQGKIFESYAPAIEGSCQGLVQLRTDSYKERPKNQDLYQFFFDGKTIFEKDGYSLGTGVILEKNGLILTNYHLTKGLSSVKVLIYPSNITYQGVVLGSDERTDLSLIKIEPKEPLHTISHGDSEKVETGDQIFTVGNPFGLGCLFQHGMIGARSAVVKKMLFDRGLMIDAPVHAGNSGGALLDLRGRLIGINIATEKKIDGIYLTIPLNIAKDIAKDLEKYGKVMKLWIGAQGKDILTAVADRKGVLISNLIVDSPALNAGLKIGDIIQVLDGAPITDLLSLQNRLGEQKEKKSITIKIYRQGHGPMEFQISLEEKPKLEELPKEEEGFF